MKSTHDYRGEFRSAWRKYARAYNRWFRYTVWLKANNYPNGFPDKRAVELGKELDGLSLSLRTKRDLLCEHLHIPLWLCQVSDNYYELLMS